MKSWLSSKDHPSSLADLLNFDALIAPGMVVTKDGSLLAAFAIRGFDSASMTTDETNEISRRLNKPFLKFGSDVTAWFMKFRMEGAEYLAGRGSNFPDAISTLIDAERKAAFEAEGAHYESETAIVIQYTPPSARTHKLADLMYDADGSSPESIADKSIFIFERILTEVEDALGDLVRLRRLRSYKDVDKHSLVHHRDELVNLLHFCCTSLAQPLNLPPGLTSLDWLIGSQELCVGQRLKIGDKFVCCVAIEGYPDRSYPGMLDCLATMPIAYSMVFRSRFIDKHQALTELAKLRRHWKQRERGFAAELSRNTKAPSNQDAVEMVGEADRAASDVQSDQVSFAYQTNVIVLMSGDPEILEESARLLRAEIGRLGFGGRIETVNTMEAFIGSIPGHSNANVRTPLLSSLNIADMLPVSDPWTGPVENGSALFPASAPVLLQAATDGSTPFRLSIHVGDVGHTLIAGPTGAGKSTLLCLMASTFLRHPGAQVLCIDKGYSLYSMTEALGGRHHAFGSEHTSEGLCPLEDIDTPEGSAAAEQLIWTMYELKRRVPPSPRQQDAIHQAITLMRQSPQGRTLTDFMMLVQDIEVREAIKPYTIAGAVGHLLDSRISSIKPGSVTTIELEDLMGYGEATVLPVLLTLFRMFEKSLTGRPSILILDEAWVILGHPVFREKLRDWLKTLRKKNCAVVLATQSLSDAVRSGLLDVILESCPTRILLPNEDAGKGGTEQFPGPRDFYTLIGLNEREIELIRTGIKKREYYYTSVLGRRKFELGLGPIALSFCGVSSKEDVARVRDLIAAHGPAWPYRWLDERGVAYEHLL
jgi:type IV secretion system protein VirB4